MGVMATSLGIPRSARENFRCTWEHLGVPGSPSDKSGCACNKSVYSDDKALGARDESGCTMNHS
jgi:hypothetical protein